MNRSTRRTILVIAALLAVLALALGSVQPALAPGGPASSRSAGQGEFAIASPSRTVAL